MYVYGTTYITYVQTQQKIKEYVWGSCEECLLVDAAFEPDPHHAIDDLIRNVVFRAPHTHLLAL